VIAGVGAALAAVLSSPMACGGQAATVSPSPSAPSVRPTPTARPSGPLIDVRSFGAVGNGSTDDSAALQDALASAASSGKTVYLPSGTYTCSSPLVLPSGVSIAGDGDTSWLKGKLVFASTDKVTDLKIGDAGAAAVTNARDASDTTFTDCRFHGGGSTMGTDSSVVYLGGSQGNVSHVLFSGCAIERTSYVPPPSVDAFAAGVGNTITIHEFCYLPHDGHVDHIIFRDCTLGAFNGRASGALRMLMEAYCWDGGTGRCYHGWHDLTFDHCLIEAGDTTDLDFADRTLTADPSRHAASGVLVTGCTFMGAHRDPGSHYTGLPIVYECPTGIVITHNTFYATPHDAIGGSNVRPGITSAPDLEIEDNTFDMTRSPIGLQHSSGEACIALVGFDSRVVDNTFIYDEGMGVRVEADVTPAGGNLIEGNRFTDRRTSGGEPTIVFTGAPGLTCTDNKVIGNIILNLAAGGGGVIAQSVNGTNSATGNTISAGSATPFVAQQGKLVHSSNTVK